MKKVYNKAWHLILFSDENDARDATRFIRTVYNKKDQYAFQLHEIFDIFSHQHNYVTYDQVAKDVKIMISVDRVSRKLRCQLYIKNLRFFSFAKLIILIFLEKWLLWLLF